MKRRKPMVMGSGQYHTYAEVFCKLCGPVTIIVTVDLEGVWSRHHFDSVVARMVGMHHSQDHSSRKFYVRLTASGQEVN